MTYVVRISVSSYREMFFEFAESDFDIMGVFIQTIISHQADEKDYRVEIFKKGAGEDE